MKRAARIQINADGYRLFVGNFEIGRSSSIDPQYADKERVSVDLVRESGGQIFRNGRLVVGEPQGPAQGTMFGDFGRQVQPGIFPGNHRFDAENFGTIAISGRR